MKAVSIVPVDSYIVINKSYLNEKDRLVLTMLYQPIIGSTALSLYFTLWTDLNKSLIMSNEYTHNHLMNVMGIKLDDIIQARKKLEALGLLKTLFKKGQINNYVYELYSPLSPREFFLNPILTSSLLSSVGETEYKNLVNYYKMPKINSSEFEDITAHFSDVYMMNIKNVQNITEDSIKSKEKLDIVVDDLIDFDFIISSIPSGILSDKALNSSMRKLINRLAFLYSFDNITMSNLIKDSINEKGLINETDLKKNCKNYYSFENNGNPQLIYKAKTNKKENIKDIKNIKEKLINCFETTSPYDFLRAKYGGSTPTLKDTTLIEGLLVDQELNPGVVNVLIDYVLRINDNKLNKNFVEAIASQWKMSNILTVKDAMVQAEKEYRKMNQNKIAKNNKNIEEKLPSWYKKDIKKKEMTKEEVDELKDMLSEFV